ncbi:hypothetical protein B0T21DRAFT_345011 [Apiosordaria backusii]|uniref:C2H2-type domain-containing protein n=1 Tax=Apiosordaria backusii TaxID=314023 RepID=A0AA40EST9_9PEZI|nr:hypothetical protein B0T21DRAFT_345011 [Apiosordaria backusii]
MGTSPIMHDGDPFLWLLWDDSSFFELDIDEVNSGYAGHVSFPRGLEDDQQSVQGQRNEWNGIETIPYDFGSVATDTSLDLFPALGFEIAITDNTTTPTNTTSAWTPLGWSTSPGTNPSPASDGPSSSPSQMSTFGPSPRPVAPRPIAPAPHSDHSFEPSNDRADRQIPRCEEALIVTAISHFPQLPLGSNVSGTPRRRRDGPFMPARERRKLEKPIKCPLCPKGRKGHDHSYAADLRKHIAARHKDQANQFGISTARIPCSVSGCSQTFARPDHVSRHVQRKHKGP